MASVPDNYKARHIHNTGIKVRPYTWTRDGVLYSNGQTLAQTSESPQPALQPPIATATPGCRECHTR